MGQKLVTKSQFARMAGVNPSTVSRILKTVLDGADVGGRVDIGHPSVVEYLKKKGINPTSPIINSPQKTEPEKPKPGRPKRSTTSARIKSEEPPETPAKKSNGYEKEDVTQYLDMTVNEVVFRHGTDAQFLEFLKSVKEIELIEERRLKNAQTKGDLISRHLVKVGILEHFEEAHIKMLSDGARTMAQEAKTMAETGESVEDIERFIADQITSFIKPAKVKIARALRGFS